MKKIASFTINHLTLMPGLYVSRRDTLPSGEELTTFDCRMTAPNREPALAPTALHAIEHLAATLLRNDPQWGERVVYWGPMGCQTGSYLIMQGHLESRDVLELMRKVMHSIADWEEAVPGASPRDCGNYLFMSLPEARMAARRYAAVLDDPACPTIYPD